MLVAFLIAIFAIGSPLPAQADCAKCDDCSVEAPAKNEAPCPHKGMACQVAQTCVNQMQKAPAQLSIHPVANAGEVGFSLSASVALKSAYHTPETAPPRLIPRTDCAA
jgi:hypothetical protein